MYAKPQTCSGCSLSGMGIGFSAPSGTCSNGVLIVGDCLNGAEALEGFPMSPYSENGSLLERAIKQIGMDSSQFGKYNIVACQPPSSILMGEAYEESAINHCTRNHLAKVYDHYRRPKVIVTLGPTATRTLTGLSGDKLGLDLIRGFPLAASRTAAPWLDPDAIIIPSYSPSYIRMGQHALLLVLQRDLFYAVRTAAKAADGVRPLSNLNYKPRYAMHVNHLAVKDLYNWLKLNPEHPISYDFEAVGSSDGSLNDEDLDNKEMDITQVNLSLGPEHALVYDYNSQTKGLTQDILGMLPNPKYGHNVYHFDNPVAEWNGFEVRGSRIDDTMQAFHFMYSDIPGNKGGKDIKSHSSQDDDGAYAPLQFCASFYGFPFPWKHLSNDDPHFYGAADADSCAWVRNGTFKDLNNFGIFAAYDTFVVELRKELRSMERRGHPASRTALHDLATRLRAQIVESRNIIQMMVPDDLKPVAMIKKDHKAMVELANSLQVQIPTPKQVSTQTSWDLLTAQQHEFVNKAAALVVRNTKDKIVALGFKVARFEFYNQPCSCLTKYVSDSVAPGCMLCSGTGLTTGASKSIKCDCVEIPQLDCVSCNGTGLLATPKGVKAKSVKKPRKSKKTAEAVTEHIQDDLFAGVQTDSNSIAGAADSDGDAVVCGHSFAYSECDSIRVQLGEVEQLDIFSVRDDSADTGGLSDESVRLDNPNGAGSDATGNHLPVAAVCEAGTQLSSSVSVPSGTGSKTKRNSRTVSCTKCGIAGTKAKKCACVRRAITDCNRCDGTGKRSTYAEKVCKCRQRQRPQLDCAECHGTGLFTGARFMWAKTGPFNVGSSQQMMRYAQFKGHNIPMNSKRKIAMDKETISKLAKRTKDPLYTATTSLRELVKIESSYASAWLKRLKPHVIGSDEASAAAAESMLADAAYSDAGFTELENKLVTLQGSYDEQLLEELDLEYMRKFHEACAKAGICTVHTEFQFKPASGQLSSKNPNVQVSPNQSKYGQLATDFRSAIIAPPGYTLIECDYKSFHVLTLAYEAQDPDYIRLARLDPHSFVASNMLGLPGCQSALKLPDDELAAYLKMVKKNHEPTRNKQAKPAILGYGFGMGAGKLYDLNPEAFRDFDEARATLDMLNACFPRTAQYRLNSPEQAHKQRYLKTVFGCLRWFMNVKNWDAASRSWKHGKDWEKSIAFRPANNAFCVLKLAKLRLRRAGLAAKFGLINNIHDAVLFCCPNKYVDECLYKAKEEMEAKVPQITAPDGSPFWCEVETKLGPTWADMKEYKYV